jgi:glyoxylase-like metal-dependent hydrolase (beta-lactamase superfamily II)
MLLMALGCAQAQQPPPCARGECGGFDWQPLGQGLYAAIRREPPGLLEHSNSLVIVNDRDVIVVDAQMTPAATRGLIRAIRSITRLPVSYVINTHWHDDHVFGNAASARAVSF